MSECNTSAYSVGEMECISMQPSFLHICLEFFKELKVRAKNNDSLLAIAQAVKMPPNKVTSVADSPTW
jgi:hypothetical protein